MADDTVTADALGDESEKFAAVYAQIIELRARAEAAATAAEEASRKANSESGFAYNAKQNAEDHAKVIAQIRGTVEADNNWLATTKKNAGEAAEAILAAKRGAESDGKATLDARSAAEGESAALKAAKGTADTALTATTKAQTETAALAKRAAEDVAAVTQSKANVETAASTVQALQAQVSEAAAQSQTDSKATKTRASEAQALLTSMNEVTETAKAAQGRVDAYEQTLKNVTAQYEELRAKIEALLPGATSAGLASAFRDQKARFTRPQWIWLFTFIVAIVALLVVAAFGRETLTTEPLSWDSALRHIASRLPLALPLVWLALYAGRNYMLALRLQEDYAYKEAISTSFEGYRREMANVPGTTEQIIPVLILCENVLKTLGQRPGRLYDGSHEDVTPLTPISKLLKDTKLLDKLNLGRGGETAPPDSAEA